MKRQVIASVTAPSFIIYKDVILYSALSISIHTSLIREMSCALVILT